jgi:hypothetical protein
VQQKKPMLVVTTWYDNLLEEVFREHGKKFAVVTHVAYDAKEEDLGKVLVQYSDQPDEVRIELSDELRIDLETYWVFYKIQGSFNLFRKGLGGREEIDSIVISEEDYVSFVSRVSDQHRTIPALFNLPFQQRMFLFLGCRMNDWNFRTLLHIFWREKRMQKEGGFTVRKEITEFEKKYWESKGIQIIDNTVAEFMDGLARELGIIL